jgi:hypothetical protein
MAASYFTSSIKRHSRRLSVFDKTEVVLHILGENFID